MSSTSTTFSLDFEPEPIDTCLFFTPRTELMNSSSAALASPSLAGASICTPTASSPTSVMVATLDPGLACTAIATVHGGTARMQAGNSAAGAAAALASLVFPRFGGAMELTMFRSLSRLLPPSLDFPFVLKACGGLVELDLGKQVHAHVLRSGLVFVPIVLNSVVELYAKCDDLVHAHKVFDEMLERDVVSWNTLISAYARLGQMKKARSLFDSMPNRTVVSWTALISGYTSIGRYSEATEAFQKMQLAGFVPDDISVVSVLPACARLGALELGKWIHKYANKHGLLKRTFVCNAIIEMYAKCGSINQARELFDGMKNRDVISWSTMISGLAMHGKARGAIELFVEMETEGMVKPNSITFVGVLAACAHAGLSDEGLKYFDSMLQAYGIVPEVEHYGCLIDILGKSGCISQALEVINGMPMPADAAIWGSLLSACRTHGDVDTAIIAMEQLLKFEPEDTGNYVLLSNIYAAAGKWDGVAKMRKFIRSRSMKKTPGCSSIEIDNVAREFAAADLLNPSLGWGSFHEHEYEHLFHLLC